MVAWIAIGLIVLAVFVFFKITSFRYERWWTYLIGILLIFVLFSFFSVTKANDIQVNTFQGFVSGVKAYSLWVVSFGKNAAQVTGQVANIDWNVTQNASAT